MESIKLTEENKYKLLEMCKVLFPLSKIQFTDDFYCEWSLFLITEDDYDSTLPENKVECHWFEFCTIHLWNKLYLLTGSLELKSYYESLLNGLLHPVDYLYEYFKELK